MNKNSYDVLSDIVVYSKYARYLPEKNRRETWNEIVDRNVDMHIKKYPHMKKIIMESYKDVYDKKVLPSMRSLQFGGKAIEVNNSRLYNCSFVHMDNIRAFSEIMFLSLSGVGVGISVQEHHVAKLPPIQKPSERKRRYLIPDSIEGWADSIKILLKSYFGEAKSTVVFDYSDIREKGADIITSSGKAPGPAPLRIAIERIRGILNEQEDGVRLRPFIAHRIACLLTDAVLSGGVRRSSLISLFSPTDEEMISCKTGDWWEKYPELGRANNSVVLERDETDYYQFKDIFERLEAGKSGEPGFSFTNDKELGFNPLTPCHEVIYCINI